MSKSIEVSFDTAGIIMEARPVGSVWHPSINVLVITDAPDSICSDQRSIGTGNPFAVSVTDHSGFHICSSRYQIPANKRVHGMSITMSELEDSDEWKTLLTDI
jgi:hypothetical protein